MRKLAVAVLIAGSLLAGCIGFGGGGYYHRGGYYHHHDWR
jgi:hypothetical protein